MKWWQDVDRLLARIPHAIVGGVASNSYMAPRFTADLDVAIPANLQGEAETRLGEGGWRRGEELDLNADSDLVGFAWHRADGEDLDILSLNHPWAETALGEVTRVDGLPIISLPYLVLLKLSASRATDVADLSRMLGKASQREFQTVEKVVHRWRRSDLADVAQLRQLGLLERG
ncbi:MAG TPA: hypothetical protein VG015_00495 [Candidatus Dormibacteraeota bacterium]|nr:hypothetical protein [Candidatus Dormibacteraeota bacterium]